jgi:hypothetical protein
MRYQIEVANQAMICSSPLSIVFSLKGILDKSSNRWKKDVNQFIFMIMFWCSKELRHGYTVIRLGSKIYVDIDSDKDRQRFLAYWQDKSKKISCNLYKV